MAASGTASRDGVDGEAEAEVDGGGGDGEAKKRRAKMLLSLPPLLLLSTTFHLPGLYSSASAASWDTREPEGKEGEEREEGDAASTSTASAFALVEASSRDEAPTRAPPVPIARFFRKSWLTARRKRLHAAQQATRMRLEKRKKEERNGAKMKKKWAC